MSSNIVSVLIQTLEALKENIRQKCENHSHEVLARMMENAKWRRPLGQYDFLNFMKYILIDEMNKNIVKKTK